MNEDRLTELERKVEDLSYQFFKKVGSNSNAVQSSKGIFNDLYVRGMIKTVSAGDNIQLAINELNDTGGGEIRLDTGTFTLTDDLTMYSSISLVGAGRDLTILEFSGSANGINVIGTGSAIKRNWLIKDLTLQNSNNTAGIDIDYCDFFRMENVRVTSCDQKGIRIQHSQLFILDNVRSDANTGNGYEFVGDATRATQGFTIINSDATSNGGIGFSFQATGNNLTYFTVTGCFSTTNTGDGYDTAGNTIYDATFLGCIANGNAVGFDIAAQRISVIGCNALNNTTTGIRSSAIDNVLIGNQTADSITISASRNSAVGNIPPYSASTDPSTTMAITADISSMVYANWFESSKTYRKVVIMQNTSGGTINAGAPVILKSAASGDQVTTTTSAGDNKVFGMALASISNNDWGPILVEGRTALLKVNGTTDIAIGDYLTCFTTAGIAAKAAAGNMVFAMALEAYTTDDSNGTIDALLISPRLI